VTFSSKEHLCNVCILCHAAHKLQSCSVTALKNQLLLFVAYNQRTFVIGSHGTDHRSCAC
jgi:hypothetical protein